MNPKKMSALVIDALEDIKAKNIVLLNVSKLTSMFDYIVIASGDSNRQTKALANNVREKLKEAGAEVYGSEGEETGEWVLVDLGDIVVHIMQPTVREYYRLEELWRDGKVEFPKPEKSEPPVKVVKLKTAPKAAGTKATTTKKEPAKKPAAIKKATTKTATTTRKKPVATAKSTTKSTTKTTAKVAAKSSSKATTKVKAKPAPKAAAKTGRKT